MNDLLISSAKVEIEAGAGAERPAKISALAYSGGVLPIGGNRYIIALDGLATPATIPLLRDHENQVGAIIGSAKPAKQNGSLYIEGVLARGTPAGDQVIALAKAGVELGVSVGVEPEAKTYIGANQTVKANGRNFTADHAGLVLVSKSNLREISLVPVGADRSATARIAASQKGTSKMADETTNTAEVPYELKAAWDKPGLTDSERVLARWNATRFDEPNIRQQTEKFLHGALAGALDFPSFEREILKAQVRDLELKAIRDERPMGPAIHSSTRDLPGGDGAVLQAALLAHLGHGELAGKTLGEPATQAARNLRLNSLHDILRASLQQQGIEVPVGRDAMIRAAFSTASVPGILSNAANKISIEAYQAAPSVARVVARKLSANDFKEHTGYRLTGDATFDEVGPGGEIKHGTLGESSFTFRVATHARMFGLTRQDIINDDLGKFEEVPRLLGRGAATKLEQLFWTLVLANTDNFFHADNVNFIDGANSALGITGLGAAVEALRKLVDANGDPISVTPKFLVVPPELEAVADQLFASTNIVYGGDTAVPDSNPFKGKYQPQVSAYLSNSNYTGYSATAWYLFGDPADVAAFGIAYLNGQETPTIEQEQADFNTLGIQFRGYQDFGVCQIDKCGGVKSKGAA